MLCSVVLHQDSLDGGEGVLDNGPPCRFSCATVADICGEDGGGKNPADVEEYGCGGGGGGGRESNP